MTGIHLVEVPLSSTSFTIERSRYKHQSSSVFFFPPRHQPLLNPPTSITILANTPSSTYSPFPKSTSLFKCVDARSDDTIRPLTIATT